MEPAKESHIERTATEPRDTQIHDVTLKRIDQVGDSVRLVRLGIPGGSSIKFLPGQWLDTFVPGISQPGGFSVTSSPSKACLPTSPYLELAVQKSTNPPATWLCQKSSIGLQLKVRVGGAFVWPPRGVDMASLRRIAFVAGGVGVNPLMSIVSHLAETECQYDVQFMYSIKAPEVLDSEKILFMERLAAIYRREKVSGRLQLFLTGGNEAYDGCVLSCNEIDIPFKSRRMILDDVAEVLGSEEEYDSAVVYVCGVPAMTEELVGKLVSPEGLNMDPRRVFCEKWW